MMIEFQPVRVNTGSSDEKGQLAFAAGRLVAVLVLLSEQHEESSGRWYLEHGFGVLNDPAPPTFSNLETGAEWIRNQLALSEEDG